MRLCRSCIFFKLEFKRSTDRYTWIIEVKDAGANQHYKIITSALKAAAPKWEFAHLNFVVGNCESVVESE